MSLTAIKDAARPLAFIAAILAAGFVESAPSWAVDAAFWAIAAAFAAFAAYMVKETLWA